MGRSRRRGRLPANELSAACMQQAAVATHELSHLLAPLRSAQPTRAQIVATFVGHRDRTSGDHSRRAACSKPSLETGRKPSPSRPANNNCDQVNVGRCRLSTFRTYRVRARDACKIHDPTSPYIIHAATGNHPPPAARQTTRRRSSNRRNRRQPSCGGSGSWRLPSPRRNS